MLFDSEEDLKILGNKITVGEFMSAWIDQNGYPVINVETYSDNKHLIVTQVHIYNYLLYNCILAPKLGIFLRKHYVS